VLQDDGKVNAIVTAMKSSMGMDIADMDLMNIKLFSARVISLAEYRKRLLEYLKKKMHSIAPNLATLIGDIVGARLISHAGSLTNLAKYPASTVQILGAEKALFRALKTRGNTPKYGLIFHSTFIGRAESKNKGRISRFLANKCSMASRIDCFSETSTDIFGQKLKEQVEERLKFYTDGKLPKKNIEVMQEAMQAVKELANANVENADGTEKKKKKKKRKSEGQDTVLEEVMNGDQEEEFTPSKKQKRKSKDNEEEVILNGGDQSAKKKKRKSKAANDDDE
jgi:nucleolar protein 56